MHPLLDWLKVAFIQVHNRKTIGCVRKLTIYIFNKIGVPIYVQPRKSESFPGGNEPLRGHEVRRKIYLQIFLTLAGVITAPLSPLLHIPQKSMIKSLVVIFFVTRG